MLTYVVDALKRFHHQRPRKPQDQPYPHIKLIYREKVQYVVDANTSTPLNKSDKQFIQEVSGTFLYYAWAVDATMLAALISIATQQANPTKHTMAKVNQFLRF